MTRETPDHRDNDPHRPSRRRLLGSAAALSGGGLLGAAVGFDGIAAAATPTAQVSGNEHGVARTPDTRFAGLPDYPYAPHYVHVAGGAAVGGRPLRLHYLDERPRSHDRRHEGETIVLVHGEPSWSYLWRHVVPPLVAAGHRVIVPDLIGFGRSDKPTNRFAYTVQAHVDWLGEALLDRLGLRDVTLVVHDWGGQIGLRLLADHPEQFRRVVASNTGFDVGDENHEGAWEALATWFQYTQRANPFLTSDVLATYSATNLGPRVRAAYDAPYPDNSHLEGVRRFPVLIPISTDDEAYPANSGAWATLKNLTTPFLCAFSDSDHVTHGDHSGLSDHIRGAQGQPHVVIQGAEHFLQEDRPAELAAVIDRFVRATG